MFDRHVASISRVVTLLSASCVSGILEFRVSIVHAAENQRLHRTVLNSRYEVLEARAALPQFGYQKEALTPTQVKDYNIHIY